METDIEVHSATMLWLQILIWMLVQLLKRFSHIAASVIERSLACTGSEDNKSSEYGQTLETVPAFIRSGVLRGKQKTSGPIGLKQ